MEKQQRNKEINRSRSQMEKDKQRNKETKKPTTTTASTTQKPYLEVTVTYFFLFKFFFRTPWPQADVVHSELQEILSGNFFEFGMWFLHKSLLRQYILGWKIVGSFIVNSVAHEKCKQAQKKYKNVGNTCTYCFSNERANLNLQFARHFSLWTEDGVSSVDDKMNARAWR